MNIRFIITAILLALFAFSGFAQEEKKRIRKGNSEFTEGKFQDAEKEYRKALMEK